MGRIAFFIAFIVSGAIAAVASDKYFTTFMHSVEAQLFVGGLIVAAFFLLRPLIKQQRDAAKQQSESNK